MRTPAYKIVETFFISMLCLSLLAGCHLAKHRVIGAVNDTTAASRSLQLPMVISGKTIRGIKASFTIESYDTSSTRLRGFIRLENDLPNKQEFPVYTSVLSHIRIRTSTGDEYRFSHRLGLLEPFYELLSIESGQDQVIPFDLTLTQCFDITPGRYEVFFVYDKVIDRPFFGTPSEFIEWSNGGFQVIITELVIGYW